MARTQQKKTVDRKRAAKGRAPAAVSGPTPVLAAAVPIIQAWSTDPLGGSIPLQVPAPALPGNPLPTRIIDPAIAPPARIHATGTAGFRFWTAAEALRRCAAFWTSVGATGWNPDIGNSLPVRLDDGVDLNAYYARNTFLPEDIKQGLSFFHAIVREVATGRDLTVFSGESPDVVAHELGHAVLDAIKPELWGVAAIEVSAFHEAFGDASAILTALQLPAVRQAVLEETDGSLWRNSSVSRVAEQLGFAIRQRNPSGVDRDSLRNAANSFVYVDPINLPADGPASGLTRASHNFSRVFTGAFLLALGGMVRVLADSPGPDDVLQASHDMGRMMVRAVMNAPVRSRFFQAVAEQMVLADNDLFDGRYAEPLTAALVRRGILPIQSLAAGPAAAAGVPAEAAAAAVRTVASVAGGVSPEGTAVDSGPVKVALDGATFGLAVPVVYVEAPAVDESATAPVVGIAEGAPNRQSAVQAFVETLVLRGRVTAGPSAAGMASAPLRSANIRRRSTHQLVAVDDRFELRRLVFDCGCCG